MSAFKSLSAFLLVAGAPLLAACSGSGNLEEVVWPVELLNSDNGGLSIIRGTGRNDLWAPVKDAADGSFDASKNHLLHHDGTRATSVALPPAIVALPGSWATSWAAGRAGELWMAGVAGTSGALRVVLISKKVDGTTVDHSDKLPVVPDFLNQPTLVSDHGAVVVYYGNKAVRFEGDSVKVLPDSPADAGVRPIALHNKEIYATTTPQNAPMGLMRFDGSKWSVLSELSEVVGPIGFSFAGDDDGWAFETNLTPTSSGTYSIYRYNGSWKKLRITVKTDFEFPVKSTWRPLAVLATGPAQYALLGQVTRGQQGTTAAENSVVYRTGTTSGLSEDDNTITPVEDTCTASCDSILHFIGEVDDGTFLMSTDRGGPEAPIRIFAGDRADLN